MPSQRAGFCTVKRPLNPHPPSRSQRPLRISDMRPLSEASRWGIPTCGERAVGRVVLQGACMKWRLGTRSWGGTNDHASFLHPVMRVDERDEMDLKVLRKEFRVGNTPRSPAIEIT